MPNWCDNNLVITTNNFKLRDLIKQSVLDQSPSEDSRGFFENLLPLEEVYTQFIEPLDKAVVLEDKGKRAEALKTLLGDDLKIEDDFYKFDVNEIISDPEDPLETNTVTNKTDDEEDLKNSVIDATIKAGNIPDSGKYMIHSFYNDLNAKIIDNQDGT